MQASLLLAIAAAGSVGSVCRYLLGQLVLAWCGEFPLHTFVVNALGCLLFGVVYAAGSGRWPSHVTAAILVGFFGAFTTFSSFAFDCVALAQERRWLWFGLDLVGQNVVGLLAMWGGMVLGQRLVGS